MIIKVLSEQQRDFLKNYERMSVPELEKELSESVVDSLSWQYCQLELSRRLGATKIAVPGDKIDTR